MSERPPIRAIRLMRRIDQYVGPPICFVLGAWRRLARRHGAASRSAAIQNVLVVKFWGMGSIVLTTPALRALKNAYPDCRVTFLTFEQNESVCRMIRAIDRVYPYRARGVGAFCASFVSLLRFLRREKFDTVIDLEFFSNFTTIITALSGAEVTVGFYSPKLWRDRFYSERVSFDQSRHIAEIFLKAPRALGALEDGEQLDELVPRDPDADALLVRVLSAADIAPADRPICINVNSSPLDLKRRWPLESYRELIERILHGFRGVRVVLIGSKDEKPYVAELARKLAPHPDVVDLCGSLGLEQLVLLLQRARLFIGNDSGPLHLAVAAGVPTVSFFGPETPALYGPRGDAHTVLYKNIPCSPCLTAQNSKDNSSCHDNVCMKSIHVDEAWAAVRARLAEPPRILSAERARGRLTLAPRVWR